MASGGYRRGSGRAKSGYYKGIYCGSTYELCWVIYNLDHGIEFIRFPNKLEKDGVSYYPDFLLKDGKTIIETKGYETEDSVHKKTIVAEFFGYKVVVLRKENLLEIFDYVENKYNTKNFYELYDDYRPKYSHNCSFCNNTFETDKNLKTHEKFCSRQCSGKLRVKNNFDTDEKKSVSIRDKISSSLLGRKVIPYKRKYKTVWITNGIENTRIKASDTIPEGFKLGRTILNN